MRLPARVEIPDPSQFDGPGAIFGLILAWVRHDYWHAPEDSLAFESARSFLDGDYCKHVRCSACGQLCDEDAYAAEEWASGTGSDPAAWPCVCGDLLRDHWLVAYDWRKWRDLVIQSLGMNVEGFVQAVKRGRA